MGEKMKRFVGSLKNTFSKLGSATEKTLAGLDNPQLRKMEEEMNKTMKQFE